MSDWISSPSEAENGVEARAMTTWKKRLTSLDGAEDWGEKSMESSICIQRGHGVKITQSRSGGASLFSLRTLRDLGSWTRRQRSDSDLRSSRPPRRAFCLLPRPPGLPRPARCGRSAACGRRWRRRRRPRRRPRPRRCRSRRRRASPAVPWCHLKSSRDTWRATWSAPVWPGRRQSSLVVWT